MTRVVAAADLGGTNLRAALVDEQGQVFGRREQETPADGDAVVEALSDLLSAVTQDAERAPEAAAVGGPGLVDGDAGVIVIAPNVAGFRNRAISAPLSERLRMSVFVENDASAAALGEHRFGAGRGTRHLLHVTLGTGVGGGIVIDGKLYRGARGFAGEIGHVVVDPAGPRCGCGSRGCLEALVGGLAFSNRAARLLQSEGHAELREIASGREPTAADLHAAALAGDRQCEAEIRNGGHTLGLALGGFANILNPDRITLSGGLLNLGEMLLGPARAAMSSVAYGAAASTALTLTTLDDDAGLLGAAAVAFERLGVMPEQV